MEEAEAAAAAAAITDQQQQHLQDGAADGEGGGQASTDAGFGSFGSFSFGTSDGSCRVLLTSAVILLEVLIGEHVHC